MGYSADGDLFIEMEFVPGKTLDEALLEHGRLSPKQALSLLRQLATALEHAHKHQCIHRDLKPQNVLVNETLSDLTLIDFGIAKRLDSNTIHSQFNTFHGSSQYASPEQFDPEEFGDLSRRADIYALGLIGWQMLSNRLPFDARSHSALMHAHCNKPLPDFPASCDVPGEVDEFIRICAEKRPEDRYQSMQKVITAIDAIEQQEALDEYKEMFRAFLPDITQHKRERLEHYRKRLKLGHELIQQAEEHILKPGCSWTEPLTGMEFVWIPPGSFWMGETEADMDKYVPNEGFIEESYLSFLGDKDVVSFYVELPGAYPRHNVHIRNGFWMGKYPVTQGQWLALMGEKHAKV